MKKKKRRLRRCIYDLLIYLSLLGAIICLTIGTKAYFKDYNNTTITDMVKKVFLNSSNEEIEEPEPVTEPGPFLELDKSALVTKYIEDIKDRLITDQLLPYTNVKTWTEYKVINTIFQKVITSTYCEYITNIAINKEAITNIPLNTELTNKDYNVITIKIYIYNQDNNFTIKNIESIDIEN